VGLAQLVTDIHIGERSAMRGEGGERKKKTLGEVANLPYALRREGGEGKNKLL